MTTSANPGTGTNDRPVGTLIDAEPLEMALWPEHASAGYRIRYQGVGYDGTGRTISGLVFLPEGDPPPGGWPVLSYAHGTTGLSSSTAPSQVGLPRLERAHVASWLAAGKVITATDYEGLGAPGPHPYLNGEAVADDVIDIVRAAHGLDHPLSPRWLVAGFSQGGHAALFTGLIATRYAPELDFRGTVALAPPVHLPAMIEQQTADAEGPVTVFLPFLLAGLRVSHPSFDARRCLTEQGGRLVSLAEQGTLLDVLKATAHVTNRDIGTTRLANRPGVGEVLDTCRVPAVRWDRPVLIAAGQSDEVFPADVIVRFVTDIQQTGSDVRLLTFPGATHVDMLAAGTADILAWADQALATPIPGARAPVDDRARTRFNVLDATGDGYLTRDDYEAFALRLVQAFGEPPGSPRAVAVREGYRILWQALAERSDTDGDGRVSEAEFLRWIETCTAEDRIDQEIIPLANAVIDLVDVDGDGLVDRDELTRLLIDAQVPADEAQQIFDRLDLDGDGHVSPDEIIEAVRRFCVNPDQGEPGYWLFGRF
ncbi:EF-hand domain-containing protein [Actinocrispum sp. NPDC049592]|uniref:EF-hand domain-containing protein n=1 Tax=Actinocrispum sp. NPDC049592 TaxID=3154835 RepID=UPI0034136DD4